MAKIKKLKNRADELNAEQRHEESLDICEQILEKEPDDTGTLLTKANNLINLTRFDEAEEIFSLINEDKLKGELEDQYYGNKAFLLLNRAIGKRTAKDEEGNPIPANLEEAEESYKLLVEADSIEKVWPQVRDIIKEERSFTKRYLMYFKDPESPDVKAAEILDEAFQTFSVEAMDGSGRQPGSKNEVEQVKMLAKQARDKDPKDPEILEQINLYEDICDEAYQRRFVGFKWLMILVGVYAAFLFYRSHINFKSGGEYNLKQAETRMQGEIQRTQDYLAKMEQAHDTVRENNADSIEDYEDRLEELNDMTKEDYLNEMQSNRRGRGWSNLFKGIIWAAMILLYYLASRAPVFLINRRQRQIAFASKGANIFKKVVFFFLGLFIAMPAFQSYRVVDQFGFKLRDETEISPLLIIKIVGIIFIVVMMVYIAVLLIPLFTLINYLRNYQYEKVDEFFEKATGTIKGWVGMK